MADVYTLGNVGGITKTVLYEGEMNSVGIYNLNASVKNYKFILVSARMFDASNNNNLTMLIDTDTITTTDGQNAWRMSIGQDRYIGFNFTNGYEKITVCTIGNVSGSKVAIKKVVGIN